VGNAEASESIVRPVSLANRRDIDERDPPIASTVVRVSDTSVGTHEASWDESEQLLAYENTKLQMDRIPSLLESEYQGYSQLVYGDLMLGLKSLWRIEPRML
jgi:hypothetical protein